MVDTTNKIRQIAAMVDAGAYFTINRARQYGKTTTFSRLADALKARYLVLRISFEGIGAKGYASAKEIVSMLKEYEADHHTGMDFQAVSERIYFYTGGYPFLVSWLCKFLLQRLIKENRSGMEHNQFIQCGHYTVLESGRKVYEVEI